MRPPVNIRAATGSVLTLRAHQSHRCCSCRWVALRPHTPRSHRQPREPRTWLPAAHDLGQLFADKCVSLYLQC